MRRLITFRRQAVETAAAQARFVVHVFQLNLEDAAEEMDDTDDEEITAAQQWILPAGVCMRLSVFIFVGVFVCCVCV